jgi:hypothetical protein
MARVKREEGRRRGWPFGHALRSDGHKYRDKTTNQQVL